MHSMSDALGQLVGVHGYFINDLSRAVGLWLALMSFFMAQEYISVTHRQEDP